MVHVAERKDSRVTPLPPAIGVLFGEDALHWINSLSLMEVQECDWFAVLWANPKILSRNSVVISVDSRPCMTPIVNEDGGASLYVNCA